MYISSGGNQGEVESPLPGEMRLQSDSSIARDNRTSCEWQSFVSEYQTANYTLLLQLIFACIDNQEKLQSDFQFIFANLSTLGHDMTTMIDCSEVLPVPAAFNGQAMFPAGKTMDDVEQAVSV